MLRQTALAEHPVADQGHAQPRVCIHPLTPIAPMATRAKRRGPCLDIALLEGLAQALPNLGQQRRQRHCQRYHQEQLAHHRLLQQIVRHGLPAACSTASVKRTGLSATPSAAGWAIRPPSCNKLSCCRSSWSCDGEILGGLCAQGCQLPEYKVATYEQQARFRIEATTQLDSGACKKYSCHLKGAELQPAPSLSNGRSNEEQKKHAWGPRVGAGGRSETHKATKANSPPAASSNPERAAWILESPNNGPRAVITATCASMEQDRQEVHYIQKSK